MIFLPKPRSNFQCLEFDRVSPDKSLSHRSIIFSFLTQGRSEIENFLDSQDTYATLQIAKTLGAKVQKKNQRIFIEPPKEIPQQASLQCLNSGTTMRLFAGLLSSKSGQFLFDGDKSLRQRPMQRIKTPLEAMGASISSPYAPFVLGGNSQLRGIEYHSEVSSAQVKSAFILAALCANGESKYSEDELSRNHTERFLTHLGAKITHLQNQICISPLTCMLPSYKIKIPNDPSSVMFLVVACLISSCAELKVSQVLLNPTRIYAFEILKKMGAQLDYEVVEDGLETIGNIYVRSSELRGVEVSTHLSWMIDEIPALCIAMACAKGTSIIRHAQELRFKESDRIATMVLNLRQLGIEVGEFDDGMKIKGGEFQDGVVQSYGDHRIAMSFALVGIRRRIEVRGMECIQISFPRYFEFLKFFTDFKE